MHPHHITAASLAVLAVLLTALSLRISALRLRYRTSFGDGGHKDLLLAIRAHGNTLARVVHALAMFTRQLSLRQATHVVSVLAQLGLVLGIGALLWRLA